MSPLALQVKRLGVCPQCHKRTLKDLGAVSGGYTVHQCASCYHAYLDEAKP
jgi:hypothetical protein